jgi:ribonuclease HII
MIAPPDLDYEFTLYDRGHSAIAGLDEVGRGAWAGPVFAGAVILPLHDPDLIVMLDGVKDSKQLSPYRREILFPHIIEIATAVGIGYATNAEIDRYGIVPATRLAMQRALDNLSIPPDALLTDAVRLPEVDLPTIALVKGDQKSLSIAAASILAKVSRDHGMITLDKQYPEYGFGAHKGYGTARHYQALCTYGPAGVHRKSFAPIRALLRTNYQGRGE